MSRADSPARCITWDSYDFLPGDRRTAEEPVPVLRYLSHRRNFGVFLPKTTEGCQVIPICLISYTSLLLQLENHLRRFTQPSRVYEKPFILISYLFGVGIGIGVYSEAICKIAWMQIEAYHFRRLSSITHGYMSQWRNL